MARTARSDRLLNTLGTATLLAGRPGRLTVCRVRCRGPGRRPVCRRGGRKRWPAPILGFVQEEVTLLRPLGGRAVRRGQLERLLDLGKLRNIEMQVMPTGREDHTGMCGECELIHARNNPTVGHMSVQHFDRLTTFIEKVLGET